MADAYVPRLRTVYQDRVVPNLRKTFQYKNLHQVPRVQKISLNMGIGNATQNARLLESASAELTAIAGQKPVITKAKRSISNFKLREGVPIGCRVTLRGPRMYEFLDRLIHIAIPRIRDFRGISDRSFDGRGNYSLGVKEQIIFPEIDYDKVDQVRGLDITIVTTAKTDKEALELLRELGMPFRRN